MRNLTGWDTFDSYIWGTYGALGALPGKTVAQAGTTTIDGVEYLDYEFKTYENVAHEMNIIFHNNVGKGLEGDYRVNFYFNEARDYTLT